MKVEEKKPITDKLSLSSQATYEFCIFLTRMPILFKYKWIKIWPHMAPRMFLLKIVSESNEIRLAYKLLC